MEGLPERFGKYHVLGLIARGGMAEIYKVKTVGIAGFEKVQALKRILPGYAEQPRFIRSFVDEARIAVQLNHRNIVQVFDFGKAAGELYLAMELIDGVDLKTAIRDAAQREIELPIALSCYILGEVGAGLDYAHRKRDSHGRPLDIVHCDVSPQNIALSHEGFVKILDFGIARAHIGTVSTSRRLRGKPRYMAPEQTRGDRPTAATDVFALGINAWELLTGRPLFDGRDLKEILAAVRRADVPPAQQLNPQVPPDLSAAIARALQPRPEHRGTAAELSGALHEAARRLRAGVGSRGLADWLGEIYPEQEEITRTVTALEIPVTRTGAVTTNTPVPATTSETLAVGRVDDLLDDADPVAPVALSEKRRVVAEVVLVSGGGEEARRQLTGMLADLAYKRGGVVYDQADDEVVIVYGLEVAGEDNVALAMAYALDAVEVAREAAAGGQLSVRIAARAGVTAQRRDDIYHLVGDAVEEARALARDAAIGRPLLSGGAGRVSSAYYAFRELPARRHRRRRLRVLELVGPRSFDDRDRLLRGRQGLFVGRDSVLTQLDDALARAVAGDRRLHITIRGKAGVGKSRLIAEFVARATAHASARDRQPPALIAIAAAPAVASAPFSMVIDLFQASLNLPPGRGESARASLSQRLRHVLSSAALDWTEIDEAVAAIDLAMEIRDGALLAVPPASADLRERVTAALHRFRSVMVPFDRPLLTVIEDLHLADAASIDVLRASLRPPAAERAELLVLSTRSDSDPVPADPVAPSIELSELDGEAQRELIDDRLGETATDEITSAIARRAGGNPLFIEELAAAVRDSGRAEIPASARDVIVSRVDGLPEAAKAALQRAAVIGRNFRSAILEELVGAPLHEELTVLFDEGMVTRADLGGPDSDEGELAFSHDLLQEVVYQSLSASARRDTHAALGSLLVSRYRAGRDEPPATIAHHLEHGGLLLQASAYWLRAGRLALAAYDARAAADAFSRVLAIESELPADDEGAGSSAARRREALLGRERAYGALGDHRLQGKDLDSLQAIAAGLPRVDADVGCRIAEHRLRLGNFAAAVRATESAEKSAIEAADERLRGEALRIRAEAFERQGRYDQATEALSRALEIFRRIGAGLEETRAMIGYGRIFLIRAQYESAREAYVPILARIDETGDPWLERVAHNHLAVIYLYLGEFERAMRSAERAVEICRQLGDRAREGDNLSVCGIILSAVGRHDEARDYFDRALEIHTETDSRWSRADCLVYAGDNRCRLGRLADGISLIEQAVEIARDIGAKYIEANALVALAGGLLLRGADDSEDVDRALEAATRATLTAREASLVGPEIQGLCRQAQAIWRAGYLDAALNLSTRAVRLLSRHRHVEGSEEEILYTHYRLLAEVGSTDEAGSALEQAREGFERKLARIRDPAWRRSFTDNVPLHAVLTQRE